VTLDDKLRGRDDCIMNSMYFPGVARVGRVGRVDMTGSTRLTVGGREGVDMTGSTRLTVGRREGVDRVGEVDRVHRVGGVG